MTAIIQEGRRAAWLYLALPPLCGYGKQPAEMIALWVPRNGKKEGGAIYNLTGEGAYARIYPAKMTRESNVNAQAEQWARNRKLRIARVECKIRKAAKGFSITITPPEGDTND